jgi:anti-sigma28 factor (negative regulator of flagellin synthesis)
MTSPITSYSQAQGLAGSNGPGSAAPRTAPTAQDVSSSSNAAPSPVEAVTLTSGAQTSQQLLDAARAASGIDSQTVQNLRAAIQADLYNVPPETLATSIVAALSDIQS